MSHTSGELKDFYFYCKFCEQRIPLMMLKRHIIFELKQLDDEKIIKFFYNQYCKTCDMRQNKEML